MTKLILIVLCFLSAFALVEASAAADGQFLYDRSELGINIMISSEIDVVPDYSGGTADYVRAKLLFFPRDTVQQEVLSLETEPDALNMGNALLFEWKDVGGMKLSYSANAKVSTTDTAAAVRYKVPFPIADIPDEIENYTLPTEHIDSDNPAIMAQASALAEGEDDLFVVLFNLASWTEQNVKYDLSSLTADVSQKASWVLENKVGVCDEMTSLFIAMARSLGIPARFVSGVAYTTSEKFDENWQAHGWAEVYMPSVGWVPFDPTFGEFGYVDATHVKLQESTDPEETATRYEWRGDAELELGKIEIDASIDSVGTRRRDSISIESYALRESVGFGSYNVIKTTVENTKDAYVATALQAGSSPEVVLDKKKQVILLKPFEKKEVYWLAKLTDDLSRGYVYTLPVAVYNERNTSSIAEFSAEERGTVYSRSDAESLIVVEEDEKNAVNKLSMMCALEKDSVKMGESLAVKCSLKNEGNTILRGLDWCFEKSCTGLQLNIGETKELRKEVATDTAGRFEASVTVEGDGIKKALLLPYTANDEPRIAIESVEMPEMVQFEELFDAAVTLKQISFAVPEEVNVHVDGKGWSKEFVVPMIGRPQKLLVPLKGKYLHEGENVVTITVSWQGDGDERLETMSQDVVVLEELTLWQKLVGWLARMGLG